MTAQYYLHRCNFLSILEIFNNLQRKSSYVIYRIDFLKLKKFVEAAVLKGVRIIGQLDFALQFPDFGFEGFHQLGECRYTFVRIA